VNIKKSFIARQRKRRRDPMTIFKKFTFGFSFHLHINTQSAAVAGLMLADRLKWRKN
jgi:hypothetical protein